MKLYTPLLQNYYDTSSEFIKDLIDFCSPVNLECNKDTFEYLLNNKIKTDSRTPFIRNGYAYGKYNRKLGEKEITTDDINYLDRSINALDGTLLVDVVSMWLYKHKIFIN